MARQRQNLNRKLIEIVAGEIIDLASQQLENAKIVYLWTVYDISQFNPNQLSDLNQLQVVHHQGVFFEDRNHDWNVVKGKLHYFSRVVEKGRTIQLLLEYEN